MKTKRVQQMEQLRKLEYVELIGLPSLVLWMVLVGNPSVVMPMVVFLGLPFLVSYLLVTMMVSRYGHMDKLSLRAQQWAVDITGLAGFVYMIGAATMYVRGGPFMLNEQLLIAAIFTLGAYVFFGALVIVTKIFSQHKEKMKKSIAERTQKLWVVPALVIVVGTFVSLYEPTYKVFVMYLLAILALHTNFRLMQLILYDRIKKVGVIADKDGYDLTKCPPFVQGAIPDAASVTGTTLAVLSAGVYLRAGPFDFLGTYLIGALFVVGVYAALKGLSLTNTALRQMVATSA